MAAAEDLPRDLVFVDLETTGANAVYDRITEVGIVRLSADGTIEEWSALVNPERPIPEYIESFTGISNDMVQGAARFCEIAHTVFDKLRGAVFVAHNARFDYSFLRSEFRKADIGFSAPVLCTVKLSRRLFPEHARHNLDAIIERYGFICNARHRALGDARVIHDLWAKLRREIPEATLAAAVEAALGIYKLPPQLSPELADDLPEAPGAYRFFAADGRLLYVGRAESLRAAVCGRLAIDNHDANERRLADQVHRVDWAETAGELGAVLRQAAWVKAGSPLHNRRGKGGAEPHTLRFGSRQARIDGARGVNGAKDIDDARGLEIMPVSCVDLPDLVECYGLFHSDKDARKALTDIARARQLCLKVLGLEPGEGSCVAHQMGKCKGACIGKEPPVLHEMRVRLALSALKLKEWPFPGRIALRERRPFGGNAEFGPAPDLHVIEHWAYLGTARSDEELARLSAENGESAFDPDVYKILVRYFANRSKLDWLDLRSTSACS